jgi:hypothetical protein
MTIPNAVHNKLKEKRAEIPQDVSYFSGADIPDVWVTYSSCSHGSAHAEGKAISN